MKVFVNEDQVQRLSEKVKPIDEINLFGAHSGG